MNIPFSPPDIGEAEIEEVVDTLKSGWITTGPKTKRFEQMLKDYCGCAGVACLSSATAALEMILRVLGIGKDDEVIVPAYTYTASASVVCHVGAKLVLCDVGENTFEIDYNQAESLITENTKAIIAVDLGGKPCDYEKLYEIVKCKTALFHPSNDIQKSLGRVAVLADSAHALGSEYNGVRCGALADFTSFSFHAVKNLTTGEGGAAAWIHHDGIDDDELYRRFMLLSLHGQSKDAFAKNQCGGWEYDIVAPYYKCNMTDIMASIGIAQLKRYDVLLSRRKEIIHRYNQAFSVLPVQVLEHEGEHYISDGHLYLVRLLNRNSDFRNAVIQKMAEQGIATNVHYKPLPMLSAYKNLGFDIKDYPNAYAIYQNEITLPLYSKLTDEQVNYIIDTFKKIVR
ncbi:MAG: DegT/DnrJ/EryC1/StrS family aminotransferase [Acutalibacteraceae bacterium]